MQTILDRTLLQLLQGVLLSLQTDFENTHIHLKWHIVILAEVQTSINWHLRFSSADTVHLVSAYIIIIMIVVVVVVVSIIIFIIPYFIIG